MTCGSLSGGARLMGIVRVLLLAVLVSGAYSISCPAQCNHCTEMSHYTECELSNVTVELYKFNEEDSFWFMDIICKSPGITCSDLPQFKIFVPPINLKLRACSPRIVRCVNRILFKPLVQALTLYNISETLMSEDVTNVDDVTILSMLQTDAETTLNNTTAVDSLRFLKALSINGGNLQLHPYMFAQSPNLEVLSIQRNNMTSLPVNGFDGLASLRSVRIEDNNIGNISAGSFRGLDALEDINLFDDNITYIEVGAFSNTLNLRHFILKYNTLELLPNGLLEGLKRLEMVTIYVNKVELKLGSHALSNLPALYFVQLYRSGIRTLPEHLFDNSSNIQGIQLWGNFITKLPSNIFSSLSSLTSVNLRSNSIQKIDKGVFNNIKTLQYLDLSDNKIEELSVSIFDGLSSLLVLRLNDNHIKQIKLQYSFVPEKSQKLNRSFLLSSLFNKYSKYSLPNNDLIKVHPTLISPFYSLRQLNTLDLSGNNMSQFYKQWALEMPNITMMDLSRNHLTDITVFQVDFSSLAVVIDLQFNIIFSVPSVYATSAKNDTPPTESYLVLDHNPITCGCSAYGLHLRLNGVRSRHKPTYVIRNWICYPSELENLRQADASRRFLNSLGIVTTTHSLFCDLDPTLNCTSYELYSNTISNYRKPSVDKVVFHCPKIPSSLPDPKYLKMANEFNGEPTVTLNLDHQPESIEGFTIHTLNLSNTGINRLAFRPSESLKILDISNNNLTTIPDEFLKGNITLYLFNNSLQCDCSFTKRLHEYRLIADFKKVTCANGDKIADINVSLLCKGRIALGAIIANSVIGGLFLFMIARAIYKNKKDIFTYILSNVCGRDPGYIEAIERRLDAAKQFDLFVSFAHQDEDFVTGSLLPKLENEFAQKVCVHSRDWVAGELIVDQIIQSVESSRRTIIILTESFLLSEWSFFEFRTAHNLSIQEGRPRVIIILLDEDISKDERLGPELKSYITINTYLLWGEPNFWQKLKKALPRRK